MGLQSRVHEALDTARDIFYDGTPLQFNRRGEMVKSRIGELGDDDDVRAVIADFKDDDLESIPTRVAVSSPAELLEAVGIYFKYDSAWPEDEIYTSIFMDNARKVVEHEGQHAKAALHIGHDAVAHGIVFEFAGLEAGYKLHLYTERGKLTRPTSKLAYAAVTAYPVMPDNPMVQNTLDMQAMDRYGYADLDEFARKVDDRNRRGADIPVPLWHKPVA